MDLGVKGITPGVNLGNDSVGAKNVSNEENDAIKESEKKSEKVISPLWGNETENSELENVIAMSADGDTLQVEQAVSNDSLEENGTVVNKTGEDKRPEEIMGSTSREIDIKETLEDKPRKITSFAGYTFQQIEQLYRQGRISRQEYEKQLKIKKENAEEARNDNEDKIEELSKLNREYTNTQMDSEAIVTAFSGEANSNAKVSAKERLDIIENMQNANNIDRLNNNGVSN